MDNKRQKLIYIIFSGFIIFLLLLFLVKIISTPDRYTKQKQEEMAKLQYNLSAKCLIPDERIVKKYFEFYDIEILPASAYRICRYNYYRNIKSEKLEDMPLVIETLPYTLDERIRWVGAAKHSIKVTKEFEFDGNKGVVGNYCWSKCSNTLLYSYHGNVVEISTFNSIFNNPDKLIEFLRDLI